ncbi:hypothetical protein PINS_up024243 [Pythium insidiosum]|nr:hypothetical protein PINS_up024243 [Pythium insidiosum]
MAASEAVLVFAVPSVLWNANDKRKYTEACYGAVRESDNSGKTVDIMDPKWKPFMDFMASNADRIQRMTC